MLGLKGLRWKLGLVFGLVVVGSAIGLRDAPNASSDAAPTPVAVPETAVVPEPVVRPKPVAIESGSAEDTERARALLAAIKDILKKTADRRSDARQLPSEDELLVVPLWTETREQRQREIRTLLDAALDLITDVPLVAEQKRLETARGTITQLQNRIAELREKQLIAPKEALLSGVWTDTVASLDDEITDAQARIDANRQEIVDAKLAVGAALRRSGVEISADQIDLLLDSVLSGDVVRLVATFEAAKLIDMQLNTLVDASQGNLSAARNYFAMHAALFALLVHAQDSAVEKIDAVYLPRLEVIGQTIASTMTETRQLLSARKRADQQRVLQANLKSQVLAKEVSDYYSRYLVRQRGQLAEARNRTLRDLEVADNTYKTVEVSFQLRALMKDATASFDAIQKLEAPGLEQVFKNQELRQEFENLTRRLAPPSS